jgi:glutaredoxin-like protein NrdH
MIDSLSYTSVAGKGQERGITVYALSTCGFCRKAIAFLDDKGLAYRYVYVDQIPLDSKNELKRELKERFRVDVAFPFAIIDRDKHLVGFIEADWRRTLEA